jgi:hypothetical protein
MLRAGQSRIQGILMKILLILAAMVIAIVLFRFLRSSSKATGKGSSAPKRVNSDKTATPSSNAYHAVSIKCGPQPCEQVLAMDGKRFLPAEVSQFPLADCTSSNCQCKFVHYDDRRDADSDKRAPTALRSELYTSSGRPERRDTGGRRKSDNE